MKLRAAVFKYKQQIRTGYQQTSPESIKSGIDDLSDRLKLASWSKSITADVNDRILSLRQTACRDLMCVELHSMAVYINNQITQQHNVKRKNFQVAQQFQALNLKGDYLRGQLENLTADFLSNFQTGNRN